MTWPELWIVQKTKQLQLTYESDNDNKNVLLHFFLVVILLCEQRTAIWWTTASKETETSVLAHLIVFLVAFKRQIQTQNVTRISTKSVELQRENFEEITRKANQKNQYNSVTEDYKEISLKNSTSSELVF